MIDWHYKDAGQMYLSFNAASLLNEAKQLLCDESTSDKKIKDAFSSLRTELKVDCGIYSLEEKDKELPGVSCDSEWYESQK